MPDIDMDDIDVPPACSRWPGCEGTGEFSWDLQARDGSTCTWPNCAQNPETD